jgi:hypothetical protein
MRWYWIIMMVLLLAACSNGSDDSYSTPGGNSDEPDFSRRYDKEAEEWNVADLPDLGPAPELENEIWLNVEQPLKLAGLRGKVVLLDMWTFG